MEDHYKLRRDGDASHWLLSRAFQRGTRFAHTISPLSTLLNPDSLTPFGGKVLQGTADLQHLDVSHHTKLLLHHQRAWPQLHLPKFHHLTFDDLIMGFWKWPEHTSTSPLGLHLGIYKLLAKDANCSKSRNKVSNKTAATSAKPKPPEHDGKNVLQLIHQLLKMAIQHCHTYDWWRTI